MMSYTDPKLGDHVKSLIDFDPTLIDLIVKKVQLTKFKDLHYLFALSYLLTL